MEAFEKAHLKKKTSDKYLKNHFKQLLEGYKGNDPQAIKSADKNYKEHENTSNDSYESNERTDCQSLPEAEIVDDISNSSVCTDDASDIMSSDKEDSDLTQDIFSKINKLSQELATDKSNSESSQQIESESNMLETVQEEESECEAPEECVKVKTINTDFCKALVPKEYLSTDIDMTSESSQEEQVNTNSVVLDEKCGKESSLCSTSTSFISENNDTNESVPSEKELLELFNKNGCLAMNIKKKLLINYMENPEPGKYVKLKRKLKTDPSGETDSDDNVARPKRANISPPVISITSQQKLPLTQFEDVLKNYKHSTYKSVSLQNKEHPFLDDINKAYKKTFDHHKTTAFEVSRLSKTKNRPSNTIDNHNTDNRVPKTVDIPPNTVKGPPLTSGISNTDNAVDVPNVQSHMIVVNPPTILLNAPTLLIAPIVQHEGKQNISDNEVDNIENGINTNNRNVFNEAIVQNTLDDESVIGSDCSEEETNKTNFEERIKVYFHKTTCIVVLKHPAELYINGKVKVRCLGGKAQISGFILTDSFSEIYAPNYNYSQCIKTVQNENVYYGLFNKLTSIGLSVNNVEDLVISLGKQDVVLCFQSIKSRKYDFVENNFSKTNIFSKINKNVDPFLQQASQLLGCSLFSRQPFKHLVINPVWEEAFQFDSSQPARGIICGGKRVGKSTLLKYYVNKKLSSGPVLVVDLDPGQCEFTLAGNLSATLVEKPLLGPNFTHLRKPDLMLNIGSINVMDNVTRYVNAVSDLLDYCHAQHEYKNIPWIVNTMGMCNFTGHMLLHFILLKLKPTFLIQMQSNNIKKKYECQMDATKVKENYFSSYRENILFDGLTSVEQLNYRLILCQEVNNIKHNLWLTPKDERYLSVLSYFGELMLQNKKTDFFGIIPYELPLDKLDIVTNVDIDASCLHLYLNGKIVGLCSDPKQDNKLVKLKSYPVVCHGYGLIRGVDPALGRVYIATPEPETRAHILLYADWTPELITEPMAALGTCVPYRVPTLQGHDQLMQSPKRRFNPLQLLKMIKAT